MPLLLLGACSAPPLVSPAAEPAATRPTALVLADDATLTIPALDPDRDPVLVVHLHGDRARAASAFTGMERDDAVLVALHRDGLSSVYERRFATPGAFAALCKQARAAVQRATGRRLPLRRVVLTAFSAGYGGVRAVLRDPRTPPPAAILLADGLHAGLVEGHPDPAQMAPFCAYARRAAAGTGRLWISHSAIDPRTYASTTACADAVLAATGVARGPWRGEDGDGLPRRSRAVRGGLEVRGYGGEDAAHHVAHFRGVWPWLATLLDEWSSTESAARGD